MSTRYLLLGLVLSVVGLQGGAVERRDSGRADAPGGRAPKTLSSEPAVEVAAYLLRLETIKRLEILAYPKGAESPVDLTPQYLEKLHGYRIDVKWFQQSRLRDELTSALESSAIERAEDDRVDCRWGLIFYDAEGDHVLTMYLNAFGSKGLIDGTPVILDDKIVRVLERRCAPLWE